jgi:acyl carrier protein
MPVQVMRMLADALHIDVSLIQPDTRLREDLGIDSLTLLELVMKTENVFGITIEDAELFSIHRVSDVVDIIGRKMKNKG